MALPDIARRLMLQAAAARMPGRAAEPAIFCLLREAFSGRADGAGRPLVEVYVSIATLAVLGPTGTLAIWCRAVCPCMAGTEGRP